MVTCIPAGFRRHGMLAAATLSACALYGPAIYSQELRDEPAAATMQLNRIGAAKLIVGDVKQNQAYFETMFGMKEVDHFSAKGVYDEPIMGFEDGARLALFSPQAEAPLTKSAFPVALIYTPDLDALIKRMQDANHPVHRLDPAQSGSFKIAIARDPSGNALELISRPGKWELGGAKMIVDDRHKAEEFYKAVFGAAPGQRFKTSSYDEVLMNFGGGPFLALFQPLSEAPLPKSRYPVVAIYTLEFDAVLKRVTDAGFGYRDVATGRPDLRIIVAKDPAGNAVEIIRRAPAAAK
jgi:catechol 2,3-dioxygenase-like lactoylglutathione lyase family enzyme